MKYAKYIPFISVIGDFLILNFFFNFAFCYLGGFKSACLNTTALFFFIYINIAWLVSLNVFKDYRIDRQAYKKSILFTYIKAIVFFFFLFLLFFQIFTFDYYTRDDIKVLFVLFSTSLLFWQFFLYFFLRLYRKAGYNYKNVVIVGYNDIANELKDYFIDNPWTGYHFKGFFTYKESNKKDIVGTYADLENYIANSEIDEIYILTSDTHTSIYKTISSITSKYPVEIRLVPDLSQFSFMSIKLVDYDLLPIIKIQQGPLNFWYNRSIKRIFDIILSVLNIMLVLSWLIPLLWIVNLFSNGGSVFFIQRRSGLDNHSFKLIKFRTMKKNRDADSKQAIENDERITKLGRFLRKTSLDEMPQFLNVLIGEMSVVGPRPHMLNHTEEYKALVKKFMIRHSVKPGITGYAQVRGFRGEIKITGDIKSRIKLDISYIENWTLWLDIKIILLTMVQFLMGSRKAY